MVVIVSTTPVWLGGFVNFSLTANIDRTFLGYWEILNRSLQQGELFLYCMSIIAAITWLSNKEWRRGRFPLRLFFNVFAMLVFGVSVMFFGIDLVRVGLDTETILTTSKILYVSSVAIYYLVAVYNRIEPPDLSEARAEETDTFSRSLERHRSE